LGSSVRPATANLSLFDFCNAFILKMGGGPAAGYVYFILMSHVIVPLLQGSPLLGVVEFAMGHVVAGLLMVSYVRTIASEPGYVPVEFYLEHVRHCAVSVSSCCYSVLLPTS
jgi:hypothetical protein